MSLIAPLETTKLVAQVLSNLASIEKKKKKKMIETTTIIPSKKKKTKKEKSHKAWFKGLLV